MKRFTVLLLIICLIGCTTLQPISGNPGSLQQRIAAGEVLKRGDNVNILTKDGRTHAFSVKSISASTIDSQNESISIAQVALIQKRKYNVGATALAVGLGVVVIVAVVAVVAVCSVGRCGGRSAGHAPRGAHGYTQPLPPPKLRTCAELGSDSKTQKERGGEGVPSDPQ